MQRGGKLLYVESRQRDARRATPMSLEKGKCQLELKTYSKMWQKKPSCGNGMLTVNLGRAAGRTGTERELERAGRELADQG